MGTFIVQCFEQGSEHGWRKVVVGYGAGTGSLEWGSMADFFVINEFGVRLTREDQ